MANETTEATVSKGVDLFGDEFAESQVTPSADTTDEVDAIDNTPVAAGVRGASTPASEAKFVREIDLGDGSGKQVFKAETAEALLDVLTEAQKNATIKIREQQFELKRSQRAQPERIDRPAVAKRDLSAEEILAIQNELGNNPAAAIDKIFKAQTGRTAEEIGTFINDFMQAQEIAKADTTFLMNHQEDYVPSSQNAARIEKFLADEKLSHTHKNLEYAFQELTESGLLDVAVADPNKVTVQPHQRRKPMSTGIRQSSSSRPADSNEVNAGAIKESDVEEIYKLPLEEARVKMQALMRKAKASSGQ
jgi:hypothetical protein